MNADTKRVCANYPMIRRRCEANLIHRAERRDKQGETCSILKGEFMKVKRGRRSAEAEEVVEAAKETRIVTPRKNRVLLPTGSTLLNLALSDQYDGGIQPGTMINLVGDSSAGKTFLAWTIFAEIARHPKFKDYRLIYDESEAAFFMDIHKLFGLKEGRVETDIRSATIEDFYRNTLQVFRSKEPCLYCLDSFDGISSTAEQDRADKIESDKEVKDGYKMEKAKWASEIFRNIVNDLENTESVLIVISQTRDNIGAMFGDKKTRSGGNALRFYSTHEVWLSVIGHIKTKDREIGANVRFKVKKNKLTGKRRQGDFSVYFDYGVDDLSSCIDFLLEEKVWAGTKARIRTDSETFPEGSYQSILTRIEDNNLEEELQRLVGQTWLEIESELKLDRKPRYIGEE